MKKNLQKVLILALGLTTTIASAQWSASSLARFDNTYSDNRPGQTRSTLTVDMSAVHISADYNWNTNGTMGLETFMKLMFLQMLWAMVH